MDFIKRLKSTLKRLQEKPAFFWFAVVILNELILLPALLFNPNLFQLIPVPPLDGSRGFYDFVLFFFRRENQDIFRIIVDFYLIITILIIMAKSRWFNVLRQAFLIIYFFLLIYHAYDAGMYFFFGQHPVLYNDILLLLGAVYLIVDLSFTKQLLGILGVLLLIILIALTIPYLFNGMAMRIKKFNISRKTMALIGISWILIAGMTYWFRLDDYRPITRWITPKFIRNVDESLHIYNKLKAAENQPMDSTYFRYDQIKLNKKPDIYFFVVESYGKTITTHPEIHESYQNYIHNFQDTLLENGWHSVTNLSLSPISGGRSWLSVGTLINGIQIKDQALYSYLINHVYEYPNWIRFLNLNGYHTVTLQPLNRKRPGLSLNNYKKFFNYDQYINFEDLNFDGQTFGFSNIPDQYSLFYSYENYIKQITEPIFLFFMTVSSHTPWTELPPYVKDWRKLTSINKRPEKKDDNTITNLKETFNTHFMSGLSATDYAKHIYYELDVIRDFILSNANKNSIFILIGDHQPPLITNQNSGFETPCHIISQDQDFLNTFKKYGFSSGMLKKSGSEKLIFHEGLYSLLVHALATHYSDIKKEEIPVYLPRGTSLSIVRQ